MKTVDDAVKTALRSSNAVQARPKLIAEWNMNRYYDTVVDNTPSEDTNGFDVDLFPITSIISPFRPSKGILKARIDEATIYDVSLDNNSRFYLADPDDPYKYWTSPTPTDSSGNFPNHTDGLPNVRPRVMYEKSILVNKIVIKLENYWASPNSWKVQIRKTADGSWSTISTSPTIANDGTVVLYWNGTSWSTTRPAVTGSLPLTSLFGVQLEVKSMTSGRNKSGAVTNYAKATYDGSQTFQGFTNGRNAFFNLIELSARREEDLSDRVLNVSDSFEVSETSVVYPIGTLTQNTGNVTLSNLYIDAQGDQKTGYFNKANTESDYYGLLEPNVKFNLEYIYTIDGSDYSVPQFEFYGGEWEGTLTEEVNVSLSDASKYLQELYPTPFMFENLTVPEIFQRVVDSVGFVNWVYPAKSSVVPHTVPVFWVTGEKNAWEVLDELAQGTQSAIYFDTYGKLQIKTRETAYDAGKTAVWTLRGENSGTELADIITADQGDEIGTNHVTITYQTTKWDDMHNDVPSMQKIWEPDDTVVLRSTKMLRNIGPGSLNFHIPATDAPVWPYEGIVQIEGELIKYKGKRFIWYKNGQPNEVFVNSDDEKNQYHAQTEDTYQIYNHFDGAMKIQTRGFWNSEEKDHNTGMFGYSTRQILANGSFANTGSYSLVPNANEGAAEFRNNGSRDQFAVATVGQAMDAPLKNFGTKLRFLPYTGAGQAAGMVFCQQSNEAGYYVELKATDAMTPQERTYRGELAIWSYVGYLGGAKYLIGTVPLTVAQGVWYELDIAFHQRGAGQHTIDVWVNGTLKLQTGTAGATHNDANGKFGMVTWGSTAAQFDYIYALNRLDGIEMGENESFYNLIDGGYTGDQWQREWVWGTKSRTPKKGSKSTKETQKWTTYFFDEFGPVIHEVREFDIKFDPNPVQVSRLYMSNDWGIINPTYRSNPFGAYFVLTNTSRSNEIANGEDNYTFANRAVNQVLTVIGRILKIGDSETIVSKNDDSIRARGKVETEISNQWVQSKEAAQDIADWINSHWSQGLDTLEIEIFGNPMLEITDVVDIEYPVRHLTKATHRYFITSINTEFDNGITTSLSLRRVQV